jgi:hypothetical protein
MFGVNAYCDAQAYKLVSIQNMFVYQEKQAKMRLDEGAD